MIDAEKPLLGLTEFERYARRLVLGDTEPVKFVFDRTHETEPCVFQAALIGAKLASSTPPQPAGEWRMVPVEPTGEMWIAGRRTFTDRAETYRAAGTSEQASIISDVSPAEIYRAMLAASPTPPQTGWQAGAEAMREACARNLEENAEHLRSLIDDKFSPRGVELSHRAQAFDNSAAALRCIRLPSPEGREP